MVCNLNYLPWETKGAENNEIRFHRQKGRFVPCCA